MKLLIILAAVAWSNAAKLDNTYLPPSNSQTSGGSGSFLQTPLRSNGQVQGQENVLARNGNSFGQYNGFTQNGNRFAQNGNGFTQNGNGFAQNGNDFSENNNGFSQNGAAVNANEYSQNEYTGNFNNFGAESRPERPQATFERNAAILRQDNQNDGETFSYAFETENGIYAEENGVATNGVEAQGGYSYTGDDGQVYSIRYTADQNGFVPQGDHLPTPPPVPEEILRALEQNARDEAAGIYDDGSYSQDKYSNGEDEYNNNGNNFNNGNNYNGNSFNSQNQYESDDDSVVTTNAFLKSNNGFNQASFNRNSDQGFANGANQGTSQAYLPPFGGQNANNQVAFNGEVSNQGSNNGNLNQGLGQGFGQSSKAYLPPLAQRSNGAGFGSRTRQSSFSARNGYKY